MSEPDYLVCMNCESPCYIFEWKGGEISEVLCEACGNEDPDEFATAEEIEAMSE